MLLGIEVLVKRVLVVLALIAGLMLIMQTTAAVAELDPPLGEGWYLVGPAT